MFSRSFSFDRTKESLSGGHFMSVINVLMQLRKVCNHPNLFEPRPITSSFITSPIVYSTPFLITQALVKDHFQVCFGLFVPN